MLKPIRTSNGTMMIGAGIGRFFWSGSALQAVQEVDTLLRQGDSARQGIHDGVGDQGFDFDARRLGGVRGVQHEAIDQTAVMFGHCRRGRGH